jgi:hypothetical protein
MQTVTLSLSEEQASGLMRQLSTRSDLAVGLGRLHAASEIDALLADGGGWRSQSLLRGLRLLASLSDREEHGVTELAKQCRLSPSTAHRYLQTYIDLGLVAQDPRTRRYRVVAE